MQSDIIETMMMKHSTALIPRSSETNAKQLETSTVFNHHHHHHHHHHHNKCITNLMTPATLYRGDNHDNASARSAPNTICSLTSLGCQSCLVECVYCTYTDQNDGDNAGARPEPAPNTTCSLTLLSCQQCSICRFLWRLNVDTTVHILMRMTAVMQVLGLRNMAASLNLKAPSIALFVQTTDEWDGDVESHKKLREVGLEFSIWGPGFRV
eukprot:709684-Rhodomonas_salina.1